MTKRVMTWITNLAKAERCEKRYVTDDDLNTVTRDIVTKIQELSGVDLSGQDWEIPSKANAESNTQVESLAALREMLKSAVTQQEPDFKDLKRIVGLRNEGTITS